MPRGSKPGTKRGGRKRGTPNRRTILADKIFVAAAAHPVAGWQELLSVLMDDQALPADTRLVIAQKSRSAAARSNKARAKTTNAKSAATSAKNRPRSNSTRCFALHAMRASLRKSAAKRRRGWRGFSCPRPDRRSLVVANGDLAYFTTWCPAGTSIKTLVSVEGHRWAIEDSFETAKNEFGLDHNESRSWHGWHRHVSLVMLAFAMMAAIQHQANKPAPKKTKPSATPRHPISSLGRSRKFAA